MGKREIKKMGDIGKIQKRKRSGGHGRPRAVGPARVTGSGASPSAPLFTGFPQSRPPRGPAGGDRAQPLDPGLRGVVRSGGRHVSGTRPRTRRINRASCRLPRALQGRWGLGILRAVTGPTWANKITWYSLCRGIKKT
jgi:hypothetical protein